MVVVVYRLVRRVLVVTRYTSAYLAIKPAIFAVITLLDCNAEGLTVLKVMNNQAVKLQYI